VTNTDKTRYSSLLAALAFLGKMFEVLKLFLNTTLQEEFSLLRNPYESCWGPW